MYPVLRGENLSYTTVQKSGYTIADYTSHDLTDNNFTVALRQKGVDTRIGMDIAAITLKRQANVIVLVSGDADFVPAAKFARREGMQFILDPLWQNVSPDLSKHIDGLRSGFYKLKRSARRSLDS